VRLQPQEARFIAAAVNLYAGAKIAAVLGFDPWKGALVQAGMMGAAEWSSTSTGPNAEQVRKVTGLFLLPGTVVISRFEDQELAKVGPTHTPADGPTAPAGSADDVPGNIYAT
jgi:hypothetical protein